MSWVPPSPRELLVRVRDFIRDHAEQHRQRIWLGFRRTPESWEPGKRVADLRDGECGTYGCIAGWAVVLGADPDGIISPSGSFVTEEDIRRTISLRARELLGLDDDQADFLFAANRTRDDVLEYLGALIADQAARPPLGLG